MVARKIADFDPCENVNKTTQIMPNRGTISEIRSTNHRFEQNIWKSKLVCNKKYTIILPIKSSTGLNNMYGLYFLWVKICNFSCNHGF